MAPGNPIGNRITNEIMYMGNVLGQGRIPYIAPPSTLKAKPRQAPFTSLSSVQLPAGAYMTEAGRTSGIYSTQVGRLGGYMDETGRVFLPANNQVNPSSWGGSSIGRTQLPAQTPRSSGGASPATLSASDRAYEAEKSRVAQLTAQDPELQRYEAARLKAVAPGATPEQVQSAEDIGMQIWAQKYKKTLAPKVKPGQSGYEVIQNELNAGQMGPVTDLPFDSTKAFSPTPIPPEQLNVTYQSASPVPIPGAQPPVPQAFGRPEMQFFETFRQAIAPGPQFQGSPLAIAPETVVTAYKAELLSPLGGPLPDGAFRSDKARQMAEFYKRSQLGQ